MPFVANDQSEDDQKQPNAQGPVSPTGGGAVHLAPTSGVGSAAPGGTSGAAPKPAGGQFATLNQYIDANQGQAAPLANKITGQIGQQYGALDQANQGTLQNIQGQVTNAPGYTKSDNALIAQESAAPVSFAGDSGNVANFQKQLTDTYGGPNSAESTQGYQTQQAAVNNAISNGQSQTSTDAGRQQLVAQNSAAPTTGVTALNSAILSKDPTYLGQVENAYKPFQNLVTGLNTGAQNINQTIASEQTDAANAAKNSLGAVTGQENALNTSINNQVAAQQAAGTAQNAAVKNALTTGTADPTILSQLGITQAQWNTLTGAQKAAATSSVVTSNQGQFGANTGTTNVDLTKGLTQQDPNAVYNAGNTATADQYAQAGAFNTLLGGLNLQTPSLAINSANAAQAGTAPTNLSSYDYQNTLQGAQNAKTQETAAAQAYVDALQSGADEQHAQDQAKNAAKNAGIVGGVTALTGPVGAVAAGMAGGANGALSAIKNDISNPSLKNTGNIISGTAKGAIQGATNAVNDAVKTVSNIFCFHPWTQIEMANGSVKPIWKIQVGDDTRGGKVLATTRGVGTAFYWYDGVLVTGKHAVKEDGKWVRIENSAKGRLFKYLTEVVCNLVTDKHRIWSNGIEFADEHENDNYENLNLEQSLEALNNG